MAAKLENVRAEKLLLGCLLRDTNEFWTLSQTLIPEMFSVAEHQKVYSAISDVCNGSDYSSRNIITPVSVRLDGLDLGGRSIEGFLAVMEANAEGDARDYSSIVVECWQARALLNLSKWQDQKILAGDMPIADIDTAFTEKRREILARGSAVKPKHISDAAQRVLSGSSQAYQDKGKAAGFTTGMPNLDEIMGRMLDTDLVFILGSQGEGKSSLGTQIGMHVAKTNPVLMIQMEMSDEQVAARELAVLSGLTVNKIQTAAFEFDDYDRLRDAGERLVGSNFWLLECDQLSLAEIESHAMALRRTTGCSMVIIDQLDKIRAVGKYQNKFDRLADVTKGLKSMAKRLSMPVICLAQRTRGAQRRDNPTPNILDADAPSIERDSDIVIAVFRKFSWLMHNKPAMGTTNYQAEIDKWNAEKDACADLAEIICLKRRRGRAFEQRRFTWDGNFTRFVDDQTQDAY